MEDVLLDVVSVEFAVMVINIDDCCCQRMSVKIGRMEDCGGCGGGGS